MPDLTTLISDTFVSAESTVKTKCWGISIELAGDGYLPLGLDFGELREAKGLIKFWLDRSYVGRPYMKYCFRMLTGRVVNQLQTLLDVRVVAEYNGGDSVNVYALKEVDRVQALSGARIVKECIEEDISKLDPSISDYRNLKMQEFAMSVTLPLSPNTMHGDPSFFIDLRAPYTDLIPADPEWALTTENPWIGAL